MFAGLFLKECKQTLKCLTYYVLIICMVLFYSSQSGEFRMIEKPEPGQEDYGITYSNDKNIIMKRTLQLLVTEYTQNNYVAYPVGFYKKVTLNEKKQSRIAQIISEATGLSEEKLKELTDSYLSKVTEASEPIVIDAAAGLTYEHFKKLMKKADHILGGGSNYSENSLMSNAQVQKTYEQALAEYNDIMDKDHLSGAYARLFCDYMGIILAIIPVFLAVTRGLRDRRARANEIIYSRRASSFRVIVPRYLAMLAMLMLPVIIISMFPAAEYAYSGAGKGIQVDQLAFIKYDLGWLLPTVMISTAVGLFLSELTDTAIAIIVQGLWWLVSIFTGITKMLGGYGWNLIPRHNTLGNYETFHDNFGTLTANRIFYSTAALLLMLATVYIYDLKRKGKLKIRGKIFSNRKSKSNQ